jgi:hypothetical protein
MIFSQPQVPPQKNLKTTVLSAGNAHPDRQDLRPKFLLRSLRQDSDSLLARLRNQVTVIRESDVGKTLLQV